MRAEPEYPKPALSVLQTGSVAVAQTETTRGSGKQGRGAQKALQIS